MTVVPLQSVSFRTDAVSVWASVAVTEEAVVKRNAREDPANAGSGLDLETMLSLRTTVADPGADGSSWVDLHVFDDHDQLIRSETLPLAYVAKTEAGCEYRFDGSIYRGTGASPGSVWLAPDARKVQYRLYYEAKGTVFSDGLLRQHDVAADSTVMNPRVDPKPARKQAALK